MTDAGLSRRGFLGAGLALGAGAALHPMLRNLPDLSVPGLALQGGTPGALNDIDHVVLMMQENRSFDHYFGALRGVRGFGDKQNRDAFEQIDREKKSHFPFHIDVKKTGGGCTTDPDHTWYGQHLGVGSDGLMRGWLQTVRGTSAPAAMGYVDKRDIPYHYALAEEFTVCDNYYCSAQGPTDPNRGYFMSGTIDPDGLAGGPILSSDSSRPPEYSWTTMPERLEAMGISWQVYSAPDSTFEDGDNTVIFFKQYHSNPTLNAKALVPTYDDFLRDAAAGNLPQVSWLISPVGILEHPLQSTPQHGQLSFEKVFDAVTANEAAWEKTALIISYDENGGYFDHVPPPLPEPGEPGKFITVSPLPDATSDVAGPIGLGPRVPTMVVSPFSRGGFVSSDVFDHTSTLRFLEARFGVEVPNLSTWRRETCGDLTTAFNFAEPDFSVPKMPKPRKLKEPGAVCGPVLSKYPKTKDVPAQPKGKARKPSGVLA